MEIGKIHKNFHNFLIIVREAILKKSPVLKGYNQEQVADRLIQSILTEIQSDFISFVNTNFEKDSQNVHNHLPNIKFSGIVFENFFPKKFTFRKKIDFYKKIFKKILKETISFVSSFFIEIKLDKSKISLISIFPLNTPEEIKRDNSFSFFQEFVRSSSFEGIKQSDIFVIRYQSPIDFKIDSFIYTSDPNKYVFYLTRQSLLREFLNFLCFQYKAIVLLLRSSANPLLLLLMEDLLQEAFWNRMEEADFKLNYIINTGNCYNHQLFFRRKRRNVVHHMFHYSQNSIPLSFKGDTELNTYTSMKWMALDIHWVWTRDFKEYLENKCGVKSKINVVGSILWYSNKVDKNIKVENKSIMVFDITPVKPEMEKKVAIQNNYYSFLTINKFLTDIAEIGAELGIVVYLKSKREVIDCFHDSQYSKALKNLELTFQNFRLVHHSTDLYELISTKGLVIAIPFTSVPYIAHEMNKKSIYYDPIDALECVIPFPKGINFINNKKKLKSSIEQHFSTKGTL